MKQFIFDDNLKNVNEVKNIDIIFFSVSKRELLNKDYTRIEKNIKILNEAGKLAKGKMILTFDGFDFDKREIYEIPEIREYVKNIWDKCKHIFYFLTALDNNRSIIFACLNNFECFSRIGDIRRQLHIIFDEEIKNETIDGMLKFGLKINDVEDVRRIIYTFI